MRVISAAMAVLGVVFSASVLAATPEIVLLEHDPWLTVIGSDSPSFVLYADGMAIYRANESSPTGYVATRLSAEQHRGLLARVSPAETAKLGSSYQLTDTTDQPDNVLITWIEGRAFAVAVYGNLERANVRAKAPPAFLAAFDALKSYTPHSQVAWFPEKVEVLIWPYEYSPEAPAPWPSNWPPFSATKARGTEGLRQLFIPGTELENLKRFVSNLKPKQAVSLDERKWAISYRISLPGEQKWSR